MAIQCCDIEASLSSFPQSMREQLAALFCQLISQPTKISSCDIGSDCITYTGPDLTCLNIATGTNLTNILVALNANCTPSGGAMCVATVLTTDKIVTNPDTVQLFWTATGATSYDVFIDGVFVTNTTALTFTKTGVNIGLHSYLIMPKCGTNNGTPLDGDFETSIVVCGAIILTVTATPTTGNGVVFTWTVNGPATNFKIYIDGNFVTSTPNLSYTTTSPVGAHTVTIEPFCANGLSGTSADQDYTIACNASIVSKSTTVNNNNTVTITWVGANAASYDIYIDSGFVANVSSSPYTTSIQSVGAHTYSITPRCDGSTGTPSAGNFTVVDNTFSCVTPTLTPFDTGVSGSINFAGYPTVHHAAITIRRVSDNFVVYGPTDINVVSGTLTIPTISLTAGTNYAMSYVAYNSSNTSLGSCTPYNFATTIHVGFRYGYSADDPFVSTSVAPNIATVVNASKSYESDHSISAPFPHDAQNTYLIFDEPADQGVKNKYSLDDGVDEGPIPSASVRAPFVVSGRRYTVTRIPFAFNDTFPVKLLTV